MSAGGGGASPSRIQVKCVGALASLRGRWACDGPKLECACASLQACACARSLAHVRASSTTSAASCGSSSSLRKPIRAKRQWCARSDQARSIAHRLPLLLRLRLRARFYPARHCSIVARCSIACERARARVEERETRERNTTQWTGKVGSNRARSYVHTRCRTSSRDSPQASAMRGKQRRGHTVGPCFESSLRRRRCCCDARLPPRQRRRRRWPIAVACTAAPTSVSVSLVAH